MFNGASDSECREDELDVYVLLISTGKSKAPPEVVILAEKLEFSGIPVPWFLSCCTSLSTFAKLSQHSISKHDANIPSLSSSSDT
jgi:hypothetical protein